VNPAALHAVFEHVRDAVVVFDDDGEIVGANPAAERMAGRPLAGVPLATLFPRGARDTLERALLELSELGNAEGVVRTDDAEPRELEYAAYAHVTTDRNLLFVRDVTGRFEEDEINRAIIQNAVELIAVVGFEGLFRFASPSYQHVLGYRPSDLIGRPVHELMDPADHAGSGPLFERLATGETIFWSGRVLHADGSWRTIETTAAPIRSEAGGPALVLSVGRDVTAAQELEESLRASERRYRELFENAGELIIVTDPNWVITAANRAFLQTVGYPAEDVIGQDVQRFLSKGRLDRARGDRPGEDDGDSYTIELRIRGGTKRVLEVSSRLIEEDGKTVGMQAIARDITDRIDLEERLAHAQKMEALGRLAGGIAHDFNNLLTAMVGYGDFARGLLEPGGEAHRAVEEVLKAAQRASGLTAQLLAFSRRQVVERQALDANVVVAEMGALLRRVIGEHIELELALSRRAGWVSSDRGQLEQVLTNLVVNARDSMPSEGGRIVIATGRAELDTENADRLPPGPYTVISVLDNGHGMDEDTLARIFEPFFTTKQPGHGTGLGLATVYGIVTQQGGAVEVTSTPGEGSTFVVLLPEVVERLDGDGEEGHDEEPEAYPSARILVVEDEEVVRNLVRAALELRGHEVTVAGDGVEALRLCEATVYDLLVTDVVMPHLNGPELAERVARIRPEQRILFMSGYTRGTIDERGLLRPGRAFLQKPFTVGELVQAVGRLLVAPATTSAD